MTRTNTFRTTKMVVQALSLQGPKTAKDLIEITGAQPRTIDRITEVLEAAGVVLAITASKEGEEDTTTFLMVPQIVK